MARNNNYNDVQQALNAYKPPVQAKARYMFELTFKSGVKVHEFVFAGALNNFIKNKVKSIGLKKVFVKPQKGKAGHYKFYVYLTLNDGLDGHQQEKLLTKEVESFMEAQNLYVTPTVNFKKKVEA